jgi:hypothetical protein
MTRLPDAGAIHFHEDVHGQVVAVPLDGTGPTYTGNFWFSDTESIRSVKSGEVLVEQDTDFQHVVARGSDGSRVFSDFHAHFTMDANGELSAEFEMTRTVCSWVSTGDNQSPQKPKQDLLRQVMVLRLRRLETGGETISTRSASATTEQRLSG